MDAVSVKQKDAAMDELEWIRKGLEKPGKSQTGLAQALGRADSAVSNLLNGKRQLKQNEVGIIAQYLEVDPPGALHVRSEDVAAALPTPPQGRVVKVRGYVGAGSEAHFYALADEDYEEVPAPTGASDQTVAVEIRGKSMGPLLSSWLVFYDDVRSPVTPDLFGQLCVVGLADDRILVKEIRQNGRGGFRLFSNTNEPPVDDVKIEWAAKVTDMRPR
jgi:transcriptional regulator with XRE-family HTH domain